jgi:(4S)-4-hydroxy-5-phosphonooxypentane-2,3-dione isomerase
MYVLVVTIDIKPGFKEKFLASMLDDARGSIGNEPDCVRFDVIQDEKSPNRIYLYEAYKDRAAFDYHTTTPHFLKWNETVKEWFASPPVVGAGPNLFPADIDWNRKAR